jgi:hypothetical protein
VIVVVAGASVLVTLSALLTGFRCVVSLTAGADIVSSRQHSLMHVLQMVIITRT